MRPVSSQVQALVARGARQPLYTVELWDVLSGGAALGDIIAGTANPAYQRDVTEWVVDPITLDDPGDRRASHLTCDLLEGTGRFHPDDGADAAFIRPYQVLVVWQGDVALEPSQWVRVFTGHLLGQAGFDEDRETLTFVTHLSAYSRRATPTYLKQTFISPTYGRRIDYGQICQEIATQQMRLGSDELRRVPRALGRATQFASNSIVDLTPLDALDKILEVFGLVADFDGDGRLRYYSIDLMRGPDKRYTTLDLIGRLSIPAAETEAINAIAVTGLDKNITMTLQPEQALAKATIPVGFWRPTHRVTVQWSNDRSLRATNTYLVVETSITEALMFDLGSESYTPHGEYSGTIRVDITAYVGSLLVMIIVTLAAKAAIPDEVVVGGIGASTGFTIPVGRIIEALLMMEIYLALSTVSSGVYEVRGQPMLPVYKELKVRVTASGTPDYLVRERAIQNDWLNDETALLEVAERELIFEAAQAQPRSLTLLDDWELEVGDLIFLPTTHGGVRLWIESLRRTLSRGSLPMLQVNGYKCP